MSKTVGNTIGRNNIYYKHIDKAQARYSDREYQSKKHTLFDIEQWDWRQWESTKGFNILIPNDADNAVHRLQNRPFSLNLLIDTNEKQQQNTNDDAVLQNLSRFLSIPVHIDSYMFNLGLMSTRFGSSVISTSKLLYQRFVLIFLSLMFCRWICIIVLPIFAKNLHIDSDACLYLLGDFTRRSGTPVSQLFYQINGLGASAISLLICMYCYYIRNDKKYFVWMKLFEIMKMQMTADDLRMTEYMAALIWKESARTLNGWYRIYKHVALLTILLMVGWVNRKEIMIGEVSSIVWFVLQTFWGYYVSSHLLGFIAIFRCVSYYFDIRMRKLISDANLIVEHENNLNFDDRAEVIYNLLKEFNYTCVELSRYNKFWQFFILVFYGPGLVFHSCKKCNISSRNLSCVVSSCFSLELQSSPYSGPS